MINYWWVTRPKRKLNSVPEVLSTFAELSLNQQWEGQRESHLSLEEALEEAGLKRQGERRDQGGGGARTYKAWLVSLGLIFTQKSSKQIKLTLAGEAIMNGDSPVEVLKGQVLKYQFPSSFSMGRGVNVASRFKVHPFTFLLRLMSDKRIDYLTQKEISNVVIVEGESDSDACLEHVLNRILAYRSFGEQVLPDDFYERYGVKEGSTNLSDVANTMMNWLDYTQLTYREDGAIRIVPEKYDEVCAVLKKPLPFIERPQEHEFFQRKYGIDPKHNKDTRNLTGSKTITSHMLAEQQVVNAYITLSLRKPIVSVDKRVVDFISQTTGLNEPLIIEILQKRYPNGSVGAFMTQYYEIPDVLLISDDDEYVGIIDNKAYSKYTISNDHHNRMVQNYINGLQNYYEGNYPLAFFTYIAGGFGTRIDSQIKDVINESGIHGSCINVHNMIEMVKRASEKPYSHADLKNIFSVNRQIISSDL